MRTLADFVRDVDRDRMPGRAPDRPSLRLLVGWGEDVGRQLDRLHARGRFHGEVSPSAIRIGARGARLLRPGDTEAPPEYRDPGRTRELLRDPDAGREACAAHDVYGLGASLYAAVEGGAPGCGHASAFTRPVPDAFAHIVYRALADGAGRYPTSAAMRADLSRLSRLLRAAGDGPIPASDLPGFAGGRAPAPEPLKPWRPRETSRRREVLVRVVVLLLLVAGGVATFLRHGGAAGPASDAPDATESATRAPRTGLTGAVDGFRDHLAELLAATGRTFDARDVPLVVVSDAPIPADLDWPVHPSRALTRRAAGVLREGVSADEVRDTMLAAAPGDDPPAVLWVTRDGPGSARARLYYSGIELETSW